MSSGGEIVVDQRLENERDKLAKFDNEYTSSEVAIEATGGYCYIYDSFEQQMDVTLVYPSKTRKIAEAKVKTDSIDARMLVHLLRAGLVAECSVPPGDIRKARNLVRA